MGGGGQARRCASLGGGWGWDTFKHQKEHNAASAWNGTELKAFSNVY